MSPDDADFKLLSLANDKRKFAIQLGFADAELQEAFERGIDEEWFTLVDISYIAATAVLMRVFRLTDAGLARLAELDARRQT